MLISTDKFTYHPSTKKAVAETHNWSKCRKYVTTTSSISIYTYLTTSIPMAQGNDGRVERKMVLDNGCC